MVDKFPEAFKRFERQIDISNVKTLFELRQKFKEWALDKWIGSTRQQEALRIEAEKRGIETKEKIRRDIILRRGKFIQIYRDTKGRFAKG